MKMTLSSLLLGYLLGILSPAKMISRRKNTNLKEAGTGNLGATNTALVLGRKAGYFVLSFDMLAGRLEIFPMLILFAPKTWKRV